MSPGFLTWTGVDWSDCFNDWTENKQHVCIGYVFGCLIDPLGRGFKSLAGTRDPNTRGLRALITRHRENRRTVTV